MQLRHVGVVCKDLEETLQFYSKWFGCTVARVMNESGDFVSEILGFKNTDVKTVKLNFPEETAQIELLSFINPQIIGGVKTLNSSGITHFALKVSNLLDLYNSMQKDGVFFISPPKVSEDEVALVCFCQDPNGVYIELVEILTCPK